MAAARMVATAAHRVPAIMADPVARRMAEAVVVRTRAAGRMVAALKAVAAVLTKAAADLRDESFGRGTGRLCRWGLSCSEFVLLYHSSRNLRASGT